MHAFEIRVLRGRPGKSDNAHGRQIDAERAFERRVQRAASTGEDGGWLRKRDKRVVVVGEAPGWEEAKREGARLIGVDDDRVSRPSSDVGCIVVEPAGLEHGGWYFFGVI